MGALRSQGAYPGCSPDHKALPGMEARSQPLPTLGRAVVRELLGLRDQGMAGREGFLKYIAVEFKYEACAEFVSRPEGLF